MRRIGPSIIIPIAVAPLFLAFQETGAAQEEYRGAPILTVLPKDAIPAIDRPEFVTVTEADKVIQVDEVISVRDGGSARGYCTSPPNHHGIVNDWWRASLSPSRGHPAA